MRMSPENMGIHMNNSIILVGPSQFGDLLANFSSLKANSQNGIYRSIRHEILRSVDLLLASEGMSQSPPSAYAILND